MIPDTAIENLFASLAAYELNYAYLGSFTQKLTDGILTLSETKMEVINEPVKNRKKVYFVIVESLQNITRHQETEVMDGFFSIHKSGEGFLITSGNIIENKNVESLRGKLDYINSLTQEQLKEHYYEILNDGGFSDKGGAGLGLVEMVRKSGNKVLYDFQAISTVHSYFYFQINISTHSAVADTSSNLSVAKAVHSALTQHSIKLFFQGRLEQEGLKGLISMAESGFAHHANTAFKKKVVSVMIEMLLNIYNHGVDISEGGGDKPGLILLTESDDKCFMVTGNYIANDTVTTFLQKVDYINSLTHEAFNEAFGGRIKEDGEGEAAAAGMGLADIRYRTGNRIETSVYKRSATRSFLIIKSQIEAGEC